MFGYLKYFIDSCDQFIQKVLVVVVDNNMWGFIMCKNFREQYICYFF